MRIPKTLAAGAVALAAVVTLTGCGGDGDGGLISGGDNGSSADSGLPKVSTMAELQKFVIGTGAKCSEIRRSDVDAMIDESMDPAWSIKEREVCDDDLVLLLTDDMAKFQGALAKAEAKSARGKILIGENFAITAFDEETGQLLRQGGLTRLSCHSRIREDLPSGFTAEEGLAKGCFTTSYMGE